LERLPGRELTSRRTTQRQATRHQYQRPQDAYWFQKLLGRSETSKPSA
jgi:hypothetical protein